jgi:hypothetical protein
VSTPDVTDEGAIRLDDAPPGDPERRSVAERRQDHSPGSPDLDEPPAPTSRREMRARGILLTTEVPVVEAPPGWPENPAAAQAAERATAEREAAERAGAAGAAASRAAAVSTSAAQGPVPTRRALRDRLREGTTPEAPAERTGAGTQPTIRPPGTAQGVRTVDDTGAISAIRPVVRAPETGPTAEPEARAASEADDDVDAEAPAPSPASWESAVSLPPVVVDVEGVDRDHDGVAEPVEAGPDDAAGADPVTTDKGEAADPRAPMTGPLRIVVLVLVGVILGVLVYVIAAAAAASTTAERAAPWSATVQTGPPA